MSSTRKKNEGKLEDNTNETHDLESYYQQLLNLFKENGVDRIQEFVEGKITDPDLIGYNFDQVFNLILEVHHREKFEDYLKQYRRCLKRVMPDAAAEPYKKPLKTFSHILKIVRKFERGPYPNKRSNADEMDAI